MNSKGITFEARNVTAKDDGSLYKAIFTEDGVLEGCKVSFTADSITISSGYYILCGRVIYIDGTEPMEIKPKYPSGYMRLRYRIDLTAAASSDEFTQGTMIISEEDYSETTKFRDLKPDDINGPGTIYEQELAVFQITGYAITSVVRQLGNAVIDAEKLGGQNPAYYAKKTEVDAAQKTANDAIPKSKILNSYTATTTDTVPTSAAVKAAYDRGSTGVAKADAAQTAADKAQTSANSAQTTANAALPKAGGTITGNIVVNGTASFASGKVNIKNSATDTISVTGQVTATGLISSDGNLEATNYVNFGKNGRILCAGHSTFANTNNNAGILIWGGDVRTCLPGTAAGATADKFLNLGSGTVRWNSIYAATSTISTSDKRQKKDIKNIEKAFEFGMGLQPVQYIWTDGDSGRVHYGFIAQQVKEAMDEAEIKDFAGYIRTPLDMDREYSDDIPEEEVMYGLRYEEFIPLAFSMIQAQQEKIDKLEKGQAKHESLKELLVQKGVLTADEANSL